MSTTFSETFFYNPGIVLYISFFQKNLSLEQAGIRISFFFRKGFFYKVSCFMRFVEIVALFLREVQQALPIGIASV